MSAYLKLLLIRHAQSLGNAAGMMEGQGSTALSAIGRSQSQRLAAYLGQHYPCPEGLYSSPLQRAIETAQPLASVWSCPLGVESSLQEMHQGIFQGLTWAEAQQRYPQLCQRLLSSLDYLPVPGAETQAAAYRRALAWLQVLWQRHGSGGRVVMISHGGFMQQLIRAIMGCDRTWKVAIGHTALFEFWLKQPQSDDLARYNPECWQLRCFNSCPHL